MVDSHCHLDLCEGTPAERVAAARAAGVDRLVTIGMTPETCRTALGLADAHAEVFAAVGRHPNEATGFTEQDAEALRDLAAHPRCVAIGETGLDLLRDRAPRADQERAFRLHLDLARETGKPVVIHSREAAEPTIAFLDRHADGVTVLLHCFGMPAHVEACVERGWWCSFAGNATYPSAGDLRAAAVRVPEDRLLVETDAPFLAPQPVRGRRCEPAHVALTAQALAEVRGEDPAAFGARIDANAAALFGW